MRKKIKLGIAIFLFAISACEKPNASEIPDVVKEGFTARYPKATDMHWGKENGEFEVEFKLGGKEKEAHFDEQGKFVKEEY